MGSGVADIRGGFSCAAEQFVYGVKEGPRADGLDWDVAIEFAGPREGVLLASGERVF
jgi:hypothetical protein